MFDTEGRVGASQGGGEVGDQHEGRRDQAGQEGQGYRQEDA